MSSIKIVATQYVDPEVRDELKKEMLELIPSIQAKPGCLAFEFYAVDPTELPHSENTGGDFVTVEEWQDRDALEAHANSEEGKAFREKYLNDKVKITLQIVNKLS